MAETVRALIRITPELRKAEKYQNLQEVILDNIYSQLIRELDLGEEGYIYDYSLQTNTNFVDGKNNPKDIIDEVEKYYRPYAGCLIGQIEEILEAVNGSGNKDAALMDYLEARNNGYEFFRNVRQVAGYPYFGIDKIYIDLSHDSIYPEIEVGPNKKILRAAREHPENFVAMNISYHG